MPKGWKNESRRHGLSSRGIKTGTKEKARRTRISDLPYEKRIAKRQERIASGLNRETYLYEEGKNLKVTDGQIEYLEMLGVPTTEAQYLSREGADSMIKQLKEEKIIFLKNELEENENRYRNEEISYNEFMQNEEIIFGDLVTLGGV